MMATSDDFDWGDEPKKAEPAKPPPPAPAPQPKRRVRVETPREEPVEEYEPRAESVADADPSSTLARTPPHDLDAEASVISSVHLDPLAIHQVVDFLQVEHFYAESHRRIWEAILWCHREGGGKVDLVLVGSRLKQTDRLAQVGGMPYLAEIFNFAPHTTRVREYATIVYDLWRVRKLIEQARHILVSGYLGVGDVQSYADTATKAIGEIARRSVGARGQTNVEALRAILASFDAKPNADGSPQRGIPYGYPSLDEITGGMHACEAIMVLARTGRGKTTFCTDVTGHVASKKIGVQVFSGETSKREWLQGLICNRARVTNEIFRRPDERPPTVAEMSRITEAVAEIASWTWLQIDETNSPSVEYINGVVAARCSAGAQKVDGAPLGLVVVDHLHQLDLSRDQRKKTQNIEEDAHQLKLAANRFKLPFLIAAQSVDVEPDRRTRALPKPKSGMVSYAKQAENHASKVFVLQHPPGKSGKGEDTTRLVLYPTKGRQMARREIEFALVGSECRLVDLDAETNDGKQPMLAASRRNVDTQPEPAPRVAFSPAAASAPTDEDEVPEWYEPEAST